MDTITIIIAVVAFFVGVGLAFLYILKTRTKKETNSNRFLNENCISAEKKPEENIAKVQKEPLGLEKLSKEKNDEILNLQNTNIDNEGLEDQKSEKLQKEIADQKEAIEELEDEISDIEKRYNRIKVEKSELNDKISFFEEEKRRILNTHQLNEEKLKEIAKENTKQKENLDFVSDILNANNAKNEEFEDIDHKTSDILFFIENELKVQLSNLDNNIIDKDYLNKCWSWRNQEIKTWIKNKKVVAIVGEFSSGKTSIVNRILKQVDPNAIELPVKSTETTAIPTYISKGIDFNCQFYSPSGDLKNISSTSFQKVTKSALDDINISSIVKYFVLSYKNENLSDISILDTPGFGSNSEEIINKTTEVVKEADALFWVVDANNGELNASSIDVIKNSLHSVPLYIIINKSDDKSQLDLDDLKKKVEETLNKNHIIYQQVIFFSNKMSADGLITILNSISPKENPNIVLELKNQIDLTLINAKNRLKKLKSDENDLRHGEDFKREALVNLISDIDDSVKQMESVIKIEDSFWREKYYKISNNDYRKFDAGKKKIVKSNSNLPVSIERFFDTIESHSDKKGEVSIIRLNIKNLENTKRTFEKLINEYKYRLIN